jgi:hypothetical protein
MHCADRGLHRVCRNHGLVDVGPEGCAERFRVCSSSLAPLAQQRLERGTTKTGRRLAAWSADGDAHDREAIEPRQRQVGTRSAGTPLRTDLCQRFFAVADNDNGMAGSIATCRHVAARVAFGMAINT